MNLPADDRGFALGDGLFETVLALDGRLIRWGEHMARLRRGCAALDLPAPDLAVVLAAAAEALAQAGLTRGRAAVRVSVTAGSGGRGLDRPMEPAPRVVATASPSPAPPADAPPVRLAVATIRRNETSPAARCKTLAYLDNLLARRQARAAGADDAVMLNLAGAPACATAANLFWMREGRLFTPALACGVLDGIMRHAVLDAAAGLGIETVEAVADLSELAQAEAVFLSNSLIGVRAAVLAGAPAAPRHDMAERLAGAAWTLYEGGGQSVQATADDRRGRR
ncbi:4-amino-4-deoxychorismate lyase [Caulobacter sp. CCUG 60055]|uniref:aminotransferase class IV n=1 Tax=Caulobacter sp. CCUG 60055 TaxID=2100090 RepID=UPI001FA6D69B|nr:aminotransferase class IV [Caulobacter sp. CCUG 60055]MCI3181243.1 4-amino-4-deoxychorismate lyase [Caulobacter sp. CCUG 60055]